jgi:hypothetical protein
VVPVQGEGPLDGSDIYELRIINEDNRTVRNVVAGMAVGPPVTSASPTAYVGILEGGESATARFAVETDDDAIETTTSATVTLSYTDASGTRLGTDPVSVPVTVIEPDEEADVDSVAPIVVVGVVLVGVGVWWWRRR